MTWQELVLSLSSGPVLLFSTATTGVHESDNLLAVSWCKIEDENDQGTYGTLYHALPEDIAMIGAQYHKIPSQTLATLGFEPGAFEEKIEELFDGVTAFSYNPMFQHLALNCMVECNVRHIADLAAITSVALNNRMLSAEDLDKITTIGQLNSLLAGMGKAPPFKRVMKMCDITIDPFTDELPVVTNVQILHAFWEKLSSLELLTY